MKQYEKAKSKKTKAQIKKRKFIHINDPEQLMKYSLNIILY